MSMIPAGYISGLVAWAKRPDLSDSEKSDRQKQLLAAHDSLISGTLAKSVRTLTSGSVSGKAFTFDPGIGQAEKFAVITAVLDRLGLLPADYRLPSITFADFSQISR